MSNRQPYYIGVKGIITKDGKILVLQDASTGMWELPGGRIDQGEDIEAAFNRELGEELPGASLVSFGEVTHAAHGNFLVENGNRLMLLYFEVQADLPPEITLSEEHEGYA